LVDHKTVASILPPARRNGNCRVAELERAGIEPAAKRPARIHAEAVFDKWLSRRVDFGAPILAEEIGEYPGRSGNRKILGDLVPIRVLLGIRNKQRHPHE